MIYDAPASFESQQAFGTSSQVHHYYDEHKTLVLSLHRYLHPDYSLGGSGLPDPKGILHKGVWYFCH
jgi:hypothetical protein